MRNLRIYRLFRLPSAEFSEHQRSLQYLAPSASLRFLCVNYTAKKMGDIPYHIVADMKEQLSKPTHESIYFAFHAFFGISRFVFYNLKTISFFSALNYITDELHHWENLEKNLFQSSANPSDLEEAGAHRLDAFGILNQIIPVANIFKQPPHEVEKWNYADVVIPLAYISIEGQVQNKYLEIQYKKTNASV